MQKKIDRIHHLWFGDDLVTLAGMRANMPRWFTVSSDFDIEIKRLFSDDVERALSGEYSAWEDTARGALALILLLDQFPRNIHRGTARAFAGDSLALASCLRMLESGRERELSYVERLFVHMPLQHAEDVAVQKQSVEWFTKLAGEAPPGLDEIAAGNLKYAELHKEIIDRFGRFPHRNAILGRQSTDEERSYLESSGTDFGQSAG